MISTGRSYPSIKEQINKYHIIYDYVSCGDGSLLYDNKGNIIKYFELNKDIIKDIQTFYQNLNYEEIQFSYQDGYSNILKENILLGINIVFSNELLTNDIKKDFLALKKKLHHYDFLIYEQAKYSFLCVKPENISKAFTIDLLCQKLKIKKDDVYVIGDSENDLEMIKKYNGVGMKNAFPKILKVVKKAYNEVSDYIDEIIQKEKKSKIIYLITKII